MDDDSLLGALSDDLGRGLEHVETHGLPTETVLSASTQDAGPTDTPAVTWTPRSAVRRAERATIEPSSTVRSAADRLLAAVGIGTFGPVVVLRSDDAIVDVAEGEVIGIGRDNTRGATLIVEHPAVSRRQADVERRDGRLVLTHLGSVNPTQVERSGRTLLTGDGPVELLAGDRVTLAGEVPLFEVSELER